MTQVRGFCDERFQQLALMMQENQDTGLDEGASLAVTLDGQPVVDLWAGYSDIAHTREWTSDTLVNVYSTGKIMVTITVLMLWEQGLLDLDAPISTYWPEFARNGKATVTTRQVLTHTSGLPGFGQPVTAAEYHDWNRMIAIIENAELWHEPGAISCYQSFTFGFILGELVHRISHRPFKAYFDEEVAQPLNAEVHFGVTNPDDVARVAELHPLEMNLGPQTPMAERILTEVEEDNQLLPEALATVSPASRAHTHARSIARIGSMLTRGGELDGKRYLKRHTIEQATQEQVYANDQMLGSFRRGLGFGLHSEDFPAPTPTTFHWGGLGGSFLTMDMETGITCGYAPNRLLVADGRPPVREREYFQTPGDRFERWWQALGEICRSI